MFCASCSLNNPLLLTIFSPDDMTGHCFLSKGIYSIIISLCYITELSDRKSIQHRRDMCHLTKKDKKSGKSANPDSSGKHPVKHNFPCSSFARQRPLQFYIQKSLGVLHIRFHRLHKLLTLLHSTESNTHLNIRKKYERYSHFSFNNLTRS